MIFTAARYAVTRSADCSFTTTPDFAFPPPSSSTSQRSGLESVVMFRNFFVNGILIFSFPHLLK